MERPSFQFRRREEKLDWKKLAALDVDQITRTVDYKALQDSIRQITYCDANGEFDSAAADPNLLKVFRMAQLIIEYLLQSQDFLANNLASVEQRLVSTLEELDAAKARQRRDQDALRKGVRAQASSTVMALAGHERCQFCQKVFINTTYLQSHLMRRHNHMVAKQMSNQTLSTMTQDQTQQRELEVELEQVRQRLVVAEQQLFDERRRAAALDGDTEPPKAIKEASASVSSVRSGTATGGPSPSEPASAAAGAATGRGSAPGSGHGSAPGSGHGSAPGSGHGSAPGSGQGSAPGSGHGSAPGSGPTSGPSSAPGSASGSAGRQDDRLATLLDQQAAEIRQLRQELENQRPAQAPSLLATQMHVQYANQAESDCGQQPAGVQRDVDKQTRRDMVALEGRMEMQERYWQSKLSCMRQRHDQEVEGMRRMLQEKDRTVTMRGSAEYVNIDSGPEESPRLLRYAHRHQSSSPAPAPAPAPPARNGRSRPRPCIARSQKRSRSVSGCRRIKFNDNCVDEEDDDEIENGRPARDCVSQEEMDRNKVGGGPWLREDLQTELNGRLMRLGIEPGSQRISSGLLVDKLKYLQSTRRTNDHGDRRQHLDDDINQRLSKFTSMPSTRSSRLASFAKDVLHRGADMSRSLITIGQRGRVPSSATIDAQLMQRAVAVGAAPPPGPVNCRRAASHSPAAGRRHADTDPGSGWLQQNWEYYPARNGARDDYDDDEDEACGAGPAGRSDGLQSPFRFNANASKHILERFTRKGTGHSSLIKSTTIHRVDSDTGRNCQAEDTGTRYDKLVEEKPPSGSSTGLARKSASAERKVNSETHPPLTGFGMFEDSSGKVPSSLSVDGLRPSTAGDAGFVTPATRPSSHSSLGGGPTKSPPVVAGAVPTGQPPSPPAPASTSLSRVLSGSQTGSLTAPLKPAGFDDTEMARTISLEHTQPSSVHGVEAVDARPSGSANTLSTSQWNQSDGADGAPAATATATDDTVTSSSDDDSDDDEEEESDDVSSIPQVDDDSVQPMA